MFENIQSCGDRWQLTNAPVFYEGYFKYEERNYPTAIGWRYMEFYYDVTMYVRNHRVASIYHRNIKYDFNILTGKDAVLKKMIDVPFREFHEHDFKRAAYHAKDQDEEAEWAKRNGPPHKNWKYVHTYIKPALDFPTTS